MNLVKYDFGSVFESLSILYLNEKQLFLMILKIILKIRYFIHDKLFKFTYDEGFQIDAQFSQFSTNIK